MSRQAARNASASAGDDAALLRLLARIDLDEQARRPAGPFDLLGEGLREGRPVEAVDHVEERDRLPGLVGLQGADEVQLDVRDSAPAGPAISPRASWT